jgi:hypothetical protein
MDDHQFWVNIIRILVYFTIGYMGGFTAGKNRK